MREEAGFGWYDSLWISLTVYTGAFQFLLITFLSSGASLLTFYAAIIGVKINLFWKSTSFWDYGCIDCVLSEKTMVIFKNCGMWELLSVVIVAFSSSQL